ncbi:MAG: hypothetical protein ACRDKZ_04870 [Actinomycetota bacterium]
MSITASSDRRLSWPVVAGAAVALLLAAAGVAALSDDRGGPGSSRAPGAAPPYGSAQRIKQADWKVDYKPVGLGKLTKKQRKRMSAQRPRLVKLVKDVYGAMFLAPETLGKQVNASFIRPAAKTLRRTKAGLPKGAEQVRITRRWARLAIDRASPTRATARVRVVAKGSARRGRFAIEHVASLYMLRPAKSWRVVGFEVDQGPFRKPANKKNQPGDSAKKNRPGKERRGPDGRTSKNGGEARRNKAGDAGRDARRQRDRDGDRDRGGRR